MALELRWLRTRRGQHAPPQSPAPHLPLRPEPGTQGASTLRRRRAAGPQRGASRARKPQFPPQCRDTLLGVLSTRPRSGAPSSARARPPAHPARAAPLLRPVWSAEARTRPHPRALRHPQDPTPASWRLPPRPPPPCHAVVRSRGGGRQWDRVRPRCSSGGAVFSVSRGHAPPRSRGKEAAGHGGHVVCGQWGDDGHLGPRSRRERGRAGAE